MVAFIFIIILGVVAVGAIAFSFFFSDSFPRTGWRIAGAVALIAALVLTFFSTFYTNGQGEAKVILNFDGTVAGQDVDPGAEWKAPWQNFSDWDLFSQEISYVGDGETNYSGGKVNGPQITSSVANGAQVNMDLSVVYSLDGEGVTDLYKQFRSQENFTKQVIENAIRSVTRDIPSQYTAVDFRGGARAEAQQKMQDALQTKLDPYGIKIEVLNLQEIRYSEDVENALKNVEVANQNQAKAEADLAAAQITAQQKVVEAQAEADATAVRNSQQPSQAVLQQQYIEALKNSGTIFVVPSDSQPLITVPAAPAAQ